MTKEHINVADKSRLEQVLFNLKRARGITENARGCNPEILARVKADEEADVTAEKARAKGGRGDELERLSLLDVLTELHNYRVFVKELQAELRRAERYKYDLALALLSVDEFPSINERFGQLTGESVLKVVANVLRNSIREGDIAARYGGPIFAMIMPRASLSGAALISEKIREKIATQVMVYNGQNFSVVTSIGIASYPEHAQKYDELIAHAMEVMALAKERGGDRVVVV
jgi:two-component system, cell cycle response regulator